MMKHHRSIDQKVAVGGVLAVASIGIVLAAVVSGLLAINRTVPNSGSFKTIGVSVYWDSACTNTTLSIPWGTLEPGSTKSCTIYIKNNGTIPTILSITTSKWNPTSAPNYLTLNSNCTNYMLNPGAIIATVLTLSTSPNTNSITDFTFDLTITGTEKT